MMPTTPCGERGFNGSAGEREPLPAFPQMPSPPPDALLFWRASNASEGHLIPIQNNSGLPQGRKGGASAYLIHQAAHGERDHDPLLFAKPTAVGSAGYRFPAKYLGRFSCV